MSEPSRRTQSRDQVAGLVTLEQSLVQKKSRSKGQGKQSKANVRHISTSSILNSVGIEGLHTGSRIADKDGIFFAAGCRIQESIAGATFF